MAKKINTFNQGIDQDSSKNKYDDRHYYEAHNVRLNTQDGLSGGALEDIDGTLERIVLPSVNYKIIGGCILRDDIILFLHATIFIADDIIIRIPIEEIEALTTDQTYNVDLTNYHLIQDPDDGYNVLYKGDLQLSPEYPIKAIPRYENEHIRKVYWTDNRNNLRWLNTVYNADTNDLVNLPLDHLEVVGNFDMTIPEITDVIAGELKTGKIQYAYQLYMNNGSQTTFSPTSPLYHVTQADDQEPTSINYFGSDIDDNTGKGFRGQISIPAGQYYSRCRVVAVQYFTYTDEPEIRIVSESEISGNTINFTDVGQTLGNLTLEDFRILSTSLFTAGDIETKDNILFAANVMEDSFDVDFDARAYRFTGNNTDFNGGDPAHDYTQAPTPTRTARLYNFQNIGTLDLTLSLRYQTIDGATKAFSPGGTWADIPDDEDAINMYNNPKLQNNPVSGGASYPWSYNYRYQSDGVTPGGEGPNVSYEFITETMKVSHDFVTGTGTYPDAYKIYSSLESGFGNDNFSYTGQESPYQSAKYAGYLHDEIYRFGIVFFDDKGRSSFVKWIGDIRFPSLSFPEAGFFDLGGVIGDYQGGLTYSDGNDVTAKITGIKFRVTNIPANAVSWQIVRVIRDSSDKSILTQGMVNEPDDDPSLANTVNFDRWQQIGNNTHNVYQLHSPEIAFNKNITHRAGSDYLKVVAQTYNGLGKGYSLFTPVLSPPPGEPDYTEIMDLTRYHVYRLYSPIEELRGAKVTEMDDGKVITQQQITVSLGSVAYDVPSTNTTGTQLRATKGINFACQTPTTWHPDGNSYTDYCLVNYCRDVFESQYGGITAESRRNSEYIVAGTLKTGTGSDSVFGGDTYVGLYDCHYSAHSQGEGVHVSGLRNDAVYIMCESSFNLPLRADNCYSRAIEEPDSCLIHETAGVWDDGALRLYYQDRDLHIYNSVFSRQNDTRLFVNAPFDWREITTFDSRILASFTKTNGEATDSWLLFPANQFIDVDPQYGAVKALKTVNNKLLYFQDTAFGVVAVNERALIQTGDVSQLSLGVADLLSRYDYAKTNIGCYHWRHLTLTPNALYWVDMLGKALYKYGKGPEEVSLMKGMDSWFRANIRGENISDKPVHYEIDGGMHMWQDPEFKEVYLTDDTGNWTLMYSELTDSFICFTDHNPHFVINYYDKTLSTRVAQDIHRHNDFYSNRGYIYDSYRTIDLTLLINPSSEDVAVFNNFEWFTEAFTSGVDQPETWNSIEMWNDYQHTGVIPLVVGQDVKRRMRKWRFTIPRAAYLADGITPQPDSVRYARMRDTHMFAKFSYIGDDDKTLVMHDILTSHTISNT